MAGDTFLYCKPLSVWLSRKRANINLWTLSTKYNRKKNSVWSIIVQYSSIRDTFWDVIWRSQLFIYPLAEKLEFMCKTYHILVDQRSLKAFSQMPRLSYVKSTLASGDLELLSCWDLSPSLLYFLFALTTVYVERMRWI